MAVMSINCRKEQDLTCFFLYIDGVTNKGVESGILSVKKVEKMVYNC